MSRKRSSTESASWRLRLAALALTLLAVVVVFAVRFGSRGDKEIEAVLWAGLPVILGVVVCVVLAQMKRFSSSHNKWKIYTYVLVIASIAILLKTFL